MCLKNWTHHINVSRKTLSQLHKNKGNQNIDTPSILTLIWISISFKQQRQQSTTWYRTDYIYNSTSCNIYLHQTLHYPGLCSGSVSSSLLPGCWAGQQAGSAGCSLVWRRTGSIGHHLNIHIINITTRHRLFWPQSAFTPVSHIVTLYKHPVPVVSHSITLYKHPVVLYSVTLYEHPVMP